MIHVEQYLHVDYVVLLIAGNITNQLLLLSSQMHGGFRMKQ